MCVHSLTYCLEKGKIDLLGCLDIYALNLWPHYKLLTCLGCNLTLARSQLKSRGWMDDQSMKKGK